MRTSIIESDQSAIIEGIKKVAIGKKGSKPLDAALIDKILSDLQNGSVSDVIKGAFFGALIIKGLTEEESRLIDIFPHRDMASIIEALAPDAPENIKQYCKKLLEGETLSGEDAKVLGRFLLSDAPGDAARGIAASVLRVRYETADEYEGLLASMTETIIPAFRQQPGTSKPIIQLAEPFDGCDHSNLITPVIADYLQSSGYATVSLVGRNSGPKLGNNLADIAKALNAKFLQNSSELTDECPAFGYYAHQNTIAPPVDRWVDLRRQIVKRPFFATLERFLNPVHAQFLIASAFHPPYGDKMLTIAERAGFEGAVIIRNGLEGTTAFPLMRAAKILCAARQADGTYQRLEFEFSAAKRLDIKVRKEERLESPSVEKNVVLIKTYAENKKTDYELFDLRIKTTCAGLNKALEWIHSKRKDT